jgi:mono/diheme cytochrome c family protein
MAKLPDIDLDLKLPKPPFWLVSAFIILVILSWLPLVFIARARVSYSTKPRVHLFHDMDHQAKVKTQRDSPVFADGRTMRPPIEGTVARGELRADDHLYRGYRMVQGENGNYQAEYFDNLPDQIELDRALLEQGRTAYTTYCYPCHGGAGYGNGPVHQRAQSVLAAGGTDTTWVPPTSMHSALVRQRQDGYLYHVINNGVRNMPGYGSQTEVKERWSIVAYIRAMQLAERYPYERLSAAQKQKLPEAQQTDPGSDL